MSGFAFNFFPEETRTEKHSISDEETEERDLKKSKWNQSDSSTRENPGINAYKRCSWSDMMRECLEDTEIEKINCGMGKDGHPITLCCLNPVLVEARVVAQMEEDLGSKGISEAVKK